MGEQLAMSSLAGNDGKVERRLCGRATQEGYRVKGSSCCGSSNDCEPWACGWRRIEEVVGSIAHKVGPAGQQKLASADRSRKRHLRQHEPL